MPTVCTNESRPRLDTFHWFQYFQRVNSPHLAASKPCDIFNVVHLMASVRRSGRDSSATLKPGCLRKIINVLEGWNYHLSVYLSGFVFRIHLLFDLFCFDDALSRSDGAPSSRRQLRLLTVRPSRTWSPRERHFASLNGFLGDRETTFITRRFSFFLVFLPFASDTQEAGGASPLYMCFSVIMEPLVNNAAGKRAWGAAKIALPELLFSSGLSLSSSPLAALCQTLLFVVC